MHMTVTVCHPGDRLADLDHHYSKVIIIHADQSQKQVINILVLIMVKSTVVSLNKTRHKIDENTKGSKNIKIHQRDYTKYIFIVPQAGCQE